MSECNRFLVFVVDIEPISTASYSNESCDKTFIVSIRVMLRVNFKNDGDDTMECFEIMEIY